MYHRPDRDEDDNALAGPSDWYRRSPTPDHPPKAWREASESSVAYSPSEGPGDVWNAHPLSPAGKLPFSEPSPAPEGSEKEWNHHPADTELEQTGNGETGDSTPSGSIIDFRALSRSGSSLSFNADPLLNDKSTSTRPAPSPIISRLRSHHRAISSSQSSIRSQRLHARTPSQFSQLPVDALPDEPAFAFHPLRHLSVGFRDQRPTALDVRGMIAVGHASGRIAVYNFAQEIKHTLGTDVTVRSGPITAVRISADETFIAVGHESGNIHLWDLSNPSKPARSAIAAPEGQLRTGRKDGHVRGEAISQIDFVGTRHTAIISGDTSGKVMWSSMGRVLRLESNDSVRLLGGSRRSGLFAASCLPLGVEHATDGSSLAALLTPRKLVVVCLRPSPKTLHRRIGHGSVGALDWLPAGALSPTSDPVLAYSWDEQLHFLRIPTFVESQSYIAPGKILALHWFDPNHIFLFLESSIELVDVRSNLPVEHVPFTSNAAISTRIFREKIFILAGSLRLWNEKILAYVHKGDFLGAMNLSLAYYHGTAGGNLIGIPDKQGIASRLRELLIASLNWAFSEDRMKDDTHFSADGRGVDLTSVFKGLAQNTITSCLAIGDMNLLEHAYEIFEKAGIEGIFLGHLSLSDSLFALPPIIVKALISYYDRRAEYDHAESVIWGVDPQSLDIDQAATLCNNHQLWDAMIHVYNRALNDFVTPISKLLGPQVDPATVYAYLEAILMAVSYPTGEPLPHPDIAQTVVYTAIFEDYLAHLLSNTELFLHVLDIAFEHPYLNESAAINRQVIVDILLDRSSDMFTFIFIARNLPKYPQFITLPPTTLAKILRGLTEGQAETLEDRQMATEFLLSAFKPHDHDGLVILLKAAGFHRILARLYREDSRWHDLAELMINHGDCDMFDALEQIFSVDHSSASVLEGAHPHLTHRDTARSARLIDHWRPDLHESILRGLESRAQFQYLASLLEPDNSSLNEEQKHLYTSLLLQYQPDHIFDYLESARKPDVRRFRSDCEKAGFHKGIIWAMNREGDADTFSYAGQIIHQRAAAAGNAMLNGASPIELISEVADICEMTVHLAQQRPSEEVWLAVLQPLIDTIQTTSSSTGNINGRLHSSFHAALLHVISSGVAFPRLFKRLVDGNSGKGAAHSEFRSLLGEMLEYYRTEGQILSTSNILIHAELFELVGALHSKQQHGWLGVASA